MTRGGASNTKLHFKGNDEDFVIFVESPEAVRDWKKDSSIPLVQVVSAFKVFVTHKQGAQGELDDASKGTLEGEFGTSNIDDCIKQILEKGNMQSGELAERQGATNETKGGATFGKGNKPF